METVKTATGKVFQSDYLSVIHAPERVYIRIFAPLTTVAAVFGNPEETVQLWVGDTYLAQYTKLIAIIPEGDAIKICLTKE